MKQQLMYIELKTDGLRGEGRIGWVRPSKTGQTLYYQDRVLIKTGGVPLRANFFDQVTLQDFWVSKPKKNGQDALFTTSVLIDDDARETYWREIRKQPECRKQNCYRSQGKSKQAKAKLETALRRRQMDNAWMP